MSVYDYGYRECEFCGIVLYVSNTYVYEDRNTYIRRNLLTFNTFTEDLIIR